MVIDTQFGRAYNMTRKAALAIVNDFDPPLVAVMGVPAGSPPPDLDCFWCGHKGEGHFSDCVLFIANRVIQLTDEK
jgi:hypothetical protein